MRTLAPLLLAALLLAPAAVAAPPPVPQETTYQGLLLDGTGAPRTGTVDLTLRIYDAATGGTLLYTQSFSSVPLADGVFTVVLGPTGAASDTAATPLTTSLADALAADLGAPGPDRFLEVTVGTDGALSRTQILSVPYALHAETADAATDASNVNGLDATVVTEIFEHFNFDGGPPNDDPREGLADTDGDGAANFVDADNDGDGLTDDAELAQGSDINLVTPILTGVAPTSGPALATTTVTVEGQNFEPGLSVVFGSQTPAPTNVSSTSFDVDVGPQSTGEVDVEVTLANGETDLLSAAFEFLLSVSGLAHSVAMGSTSLTQLAFDAKGSQQTLVGGAAEYGVDLDADTVPEAIFAYPSSGSSGAAGQIAVAFDPAGDVAGLRCRESPSTPDCTVEVARDADGDGELEPSESLDVELLAGVSGATARIWSPSIAFDGAGGMVVAYLTRSGISDVSAVVAHDRDGNGDFTGTNELVEVETGLGTATNLGEVAVDASDRVAYAYWDDVGQNLRVAYDRSGDGDFDDTVGGNPELFTLAAGFPLHCLGTTFDENGNLAVAFALGGIRTSLAVDANADGDFDDFGERREVDPTPADACDVVGGPSGLAYVHDADGLRLRVDRNGDGDFDDATEDLQLQSASTEQVDLVEIRRDGAGLVLFATDDAIFVDPAP